MEHHLKKHLATWVLEPASPVSVVNIHAISVVNRHAIIRRDHEKKNPMNPTTMSR